MRNILKEKLARGEKPLGTFVGTGSAAVVECLGCAGLDFAILDNEHSPIEAETTARLVCAAERRNITPLARVREISRPAILKLLDVGVQGIIIPDVHSAAEVKRVVDYAKYAPVGQRGFCPSRKDGWGTDTPAGVLETMAHFNGETLVIPSVRRQRRWRILRISQRWRVWTASLSVLSICLFLWGCLGPLRSSASRRP